MNVTAKLLIPFKAFLDMIIGPFRLNFYYIYAEDTEMVKTFPCDQIHSTKC